MVWVTGTVVGVRVTGTVVCWTVGVGVARVVSGVLTGNEKVGCIVVSRRGGCRGWEMGNSTSPERCWIGEVGELVTFAGFTMEGGAGSIYLIVLWCILCFHYNNSDWHEDYTKNED